MHFLPCRPGEDHLEREQGLSAPGSPATRLMDRAGIPLRGCDRGRGCRLRGAPGWVGSWSTDALGWRREDSPLLQHGICSMRRTTTCPVNSTSSGRSSPTSSRSATRRVLDLPDESARQCVGVSCVGPQDLELAELRAVEHCPPRARRTSAARPCAENVCDCIPDQLEQRSTAHLGASSTLGRPLSGNARWSHLRLPLSDADARPDPGPTDILERRSASRKRDPATLPHSTLQIRPVPAESPHAFASSCSARLVSETDVRMKEPTARAIRTSPRSRKRQRDPNTVALPERLGRRGNGDLLLEGRQRRPRAAFSSSSGSRLDHTLEWRRRSIECIREDRSICSVCWPEP